MSTANFIKFYTEHLAKHPDLKSKIDSADSPKAFAHALMEQGHAAGFDFSEDDVEQVLVASLNKHHGKGELNESQLDGVVGGAGVAANVPTIQVSPVKSLVTVNPAAKGAAAANTVMCPGWMPPGGAAQNPAAKAGRT